VNTHTLLGGVGGPAVLAGGPGPRSGPGPAALLDQRIDNRTLLETGPLSPPGPIVEALADGECLVGPYRSGGGFDPVKTRAVDVVRAGQLVDTFSELPGNVLMVTLTTKRDGLFLFPEIAFQFANDRVREVCQALSRGPGRGIWVAVIEAHQLNGDGFIHWHCLVYAPGLSIPDAYRLIYRKWRVWDEVRAPDVIDQDTGEVTRGELLARFSEPIGSQVRVEVAGSKVGSSKYAAKYIVKPWAAVPPWMLASRRKWRKVRESGPYRDYLKAKGVRVSPPARPRVERDHRLPRLRARVLSERMARSGSRCILWQRQGSRLAFAGVVALPFAGVETDIASGAGRVLLRQYPGGRAVARLVVSAAVAAELKAREDPGRVAACVLARRLDIEAAWDRMQSLRADAEGRGRGLALDRDAAR